MDTMQLDIQLLHNYIVRSQIYIQYYWYLYNTVIYLCGIQGYTFSSHVCGSLMGHFIENHPVFRTPSTSISILYHNTRISIQVCLFQVGSFNYDITKMIFHDEFVAESSALKYEHVFLQLIKLFLLILHSGLFWTIGLKLILSQSRTKFPQC